MYLSTLLPFLVFYIPPYNSIFPSGIIFLLTKQIFFKNISYNVCAGVFSSEKVFISPSYLKDIFTLCGILDQQLASALHILSVLSVPLSSFIFWLFQDFIFITIFEQLDYNVPWWA